MRSLIKRDFTYTFKSIFIKNTFIGVVFLIVNLIIIINVNRFSGAKSINLIFEILKGAPYYNANDGLSIPMVWFIINTFVIFSLANYTYDDFRHNGKYVLTRIKKVGYFYFAKVFWLIYNVLIYYVMLFAIMIILEKVFSHEFSKWIFADGIYLNMNDIVIKIFLLYITTSIALALLQNTISLVLKPVYSYIIILVVIIISVFTVNNLLPGQHSLILRHVPFDSIHGLTFRKSIFYNFVLSIFSIMVGYGIFLKKDIL